MTFTALETLLTLLANEQCSTSLDASGARTAVSVLCPDISSLSRDTSFIEVCYAFSTQGEILHLHLQISFSLKSQTKHLSACHMYTPAFEWSGVPE